MIAVVSMRPATALLGSLVPFPILRRQKLLRALFLCVASILVQNSRPLGIELGLSGGTTNFINVDNLEAVHRHKVSQRPCMMLLDPCAELPQTLACKGKDAFWTRCANLQGYHGERALIVPSLSGSIAAARFRRNRRRGSHLGGRLCRCRNLKYRCSLNPVFCAYLQKQDPVIKERSVSGVRHIKAVHHVHLARPVQR